MNSIEEMRRHLMNCELAGKDTNEAIKSASEHTVKVVFILHNEIRHENNMSFADVRVC